MWIFEKLGVEMNGKVIFFIGLGVGIWMLAAFASISFLTGETGGYAVASFFVTGAWLLLLSFLKVQGELFVTLCASGLFVAGAIGVILVLVLAISKEKAARKRRREEKNRRLQYGLPEKENSYVRARLSTALKDTGKDEAKHRDDVRIAYVRKLLARVKEEGLTPAERIQAEEISRLLAVYLVKDEWTTEELRAVNELFSSVLKLAGKYAVEA